MRLFFLFIPFAACAMMIDSHTLTKVRDIFTQLNELSKRRPHIAHSANSIDASLPEISEKLCFFQNQEEKLTFAMAIPENSSGRNMSEFLIGEAERNVQKYGFQSAVPLIQDAIRAAISADKEYYAKIDALFISKEENKVQIVNSGQLWVGLFREGVSVNFTLPLNPKVATQMESEGLLPYLSHVHELKAGQLVQEWAVEPGDIIVITWADLHDELKEIVELAVETAHESKVSIAQIVDNLKPYFSVYRQKENVLAALLLG